jgi:hypothetical protein
LEENPTFSWESIGTLAKRRLGFGRATDRWQETPSWVSQSPVEAAVFLAIAKNSRRKSPPSRV